MYSVIESTQFLSSTLNETKRKMIYKTHDVISVKKKMIYYNNERHSFGQMYLSDILMILLSNDIWDCGKVCRVYIIG